MNQFEEAIMKNCIENDDIMLSELQMETYSKYLMPLPGSYKVDYLQKKLYLKLVKSFKIRGPHTNTFLYNVSRTVW